MVAVCFCRSGVSKLLGKVCGKSNGLRSVDVGFMAGLTGIVEGE
jgi:hypothetical protein